MAVIVSLNCRIVASPEPNPSLVNIPQHRHHRLAIAKAGGDSSASHPEKEKEKGEEMDSLGVQAALSVLRFYKREISPALPKSCRYVPTCSEYGMEAYKKYGFVKGTVLTTWRICRCNPLGGSGFDPPRWFDEPRLPEE